MYKKLFSIGLTISLLAMGYVSNAQYVFERFDLNAKGGSDPYNITATDSFLYFTAEGSNSSREPWRSDGTLIGTKSIKTFIHGQTGTVGNLLGTANGKVLLMYQ